MGTIEKIVVDDATMQRLAESARAHGRTIEDEAADALRRDAERSLSLVDRARAFRASLSPQRTDSFALLREDRSR